MLNMEELWDALKLLIIFQSLTDEAQNEQINIYKIDYDLSKTFTGCKIL